MGNLIDFSQYKKQHEAKLKEYQKLSEDSYMVAYELLIYELSTQVLPMMKLLELEIIILNENGDLSFAFENNNKE
ncbi:MAG: hypothetical protein K0R78_2857 [Pelosinus sp.]|jgi:hypothetical protein|nr:hypothetical protein [Pelosinus sp.]